LFFRGGESFDTATGVPSAATPRPVGVPTAPARLIAFFEISPFYKQVKHHLREASRAHDIDYELLQALIATESGFDPRAVSPKGAVGLMQLIPPTAERYGVRADKTAGVSQKLTDPKTNIRAGASYLRDLIDMFPGQLELAVAAYNAGEGAVQRAGNKIPNYPETKNYVKTVMQLYNHLKPPGFIDARRGGRVRMEMMGGAQGRSNMPALATAVPAEAPVPAGFRSE
ncbi:MAG: Lytic transglycosylase, catalytic, partial [Polaromonas sp.]|nr:Lytic transglycosylase, catalytic [Polaromonas sp.]